jgi:hypothetical protein
MEVDVDMVHHSLSTILFLFRLFPFHFLLIAATFRQDERKSPPQCEAVPLD